jgi:glucokinase
VRYGHAAAQRHVAAIRPHLYDDAHPPAVRVAALGDLGGALGAAMLVPSG